MYHYITSLRVMRTLLCIAFIAAGISTVAAQGVQTQTFVFDESSGSATVGGSEYTEGKGSTWGHKPGVNNAIDTLWMNGFEWETTASTALQVTGNVVIELIGTSTNRIVAGSGTVSSSYGIHCGYLAIIGSGSLHIEAGEAETSGTHSFGIDADGISITDANVVAIGNNAAGSSYGFFTFGNIEINGTANVVVEAKEALYSYGMYSSSRNGIKIDITNGSIEAKGNNRTLYNTGTIAPTATQTTPYLYWGNAVNSVENATRYDDMEFDTYLADNTPKYIKLVAPAYTISTSEGVTVSTPSLNTELAIEGEEVIFTVIVPAGQLIDTVTVAGNNKKESVDLNLTQNVGTFVMPAFNVNIIASFINIPQSILISETDDPLTARIENTGSDETGRLRLVLSGRDERSFTLESYEVASIPEGGHAYVTLIPAEGLAPGTYNVRLYASGQNVWDFLDMTYTVADDPVSNEQIEGAAKLNAYVQDGILKITGLTTGKTWQVYSLTGLLIQTAKADSNEAQMTLSQKGVYIVTSERKTIKVVW